MKISPIYYTLCKSPLGPLLLAADDKGLIALSMQDGEDPLEPEATWIKDATRFKTEIESLNKYLSGKGDLFPSAQGNLQGTDFQKKVWAQLRKIPLGKTKTYGDLAKALGMPLAARAVGMACGKNPLPLYNPCHRVIGKNGSLTGFSCGLHFKKKLLELEKAL